MKDDDAAFRWKYASKHAGRKRSRERSEETLDKIRQRLKEVGVDFTQKGWDKCSKPPSGS